jgi:hypothetical protein
VTITYDRRTSEQDGSDEAPSSSGTQQSAFMMEDNDYSYFNSLQEGTSREEGPMTNSPLIPAFRGNWTGKSSVICVPENSSLTRKLPVSTVSTSCSDHDNDAVKSSLSSLDHDFLCFLVIDFIFPLVSGRSKKANTRYRLY